MYFPPNYSGTLNQRPIGGTTDVSSDPPEFIARVRIRHDDSGMLSVYNHFGGGSQMMEVEDKALAELLRGRWDEIRVEQLGSPRDAIIKADQAAVLLRLTLPEELQRKAREKLPAEDQARYVPIFFELDLNPTPSVP